MNNSALQSGGGINYNFKRPLLNDNVFTNNSASYGPNIASYAVKIFEKDKLGESIVMKDVGSGILWNETLKLVLADYDNQTMVLDDSSQIKISALDANSKVSGTDSVKVSKGIAEFSNLIFISKVGSKNVKYQATSKGIDNTKIQRAFGNAISENKIDVSFRYCKPGEIELPSNE